MPIGEARNAALGVILGLSIGVADAIVMKAYAPILITGVIFG